MVTPMTSRDPMTS